jgi:dihydroxyacetone kinase
MRDIRVRCLQLGTRCQRGPAVAKFKLGSGAVPLVNGFGERPAIELYLVYREAAKILHAAGVKPVRSLVGSCGTV